MYFRLPETAVKVLCLFIPAVPVFRTAPYHLGNVMILFWPTLISAPQES
jgi:hypothetical protein